MTTTHRLFATLLVATIALLQACGGGGAGGTSDSGSATVALPVQVDSARATTATLGAAGGTLSATAADGRVYTLTVPAGALAADTAISATPITSMGSAPLAAGLKGAVRFGPAGLKFALPATLRIEGAATTAAAGKRLVGFVRSNDGATHNLVPVALAGSALQVPVLHFSDGGVAEASAAELAAIPLAPITDPVQEIWDTALREASPSGSEDQNAAMLARLHDQKLQPLLDTAATLAADVTQDAFRESAVATWAAWQGMVDFFAVPAAKLGNRVDQARARTSALLADQVVRGKAACLAPLPLNLPQLQGLWRALWAQVLAQQYGLDSPAQALDAASVARSLNDCARVAFVPRPEPALEAGRAVSLDTQADLIFAAAPNEQAPVQFEFAVSSADAGIANPRGFGNGAGQYTTVVTPRNGGALFEVQACLLTFLANGTPVPGVMCARQTLGGGVLAGSVPQQLSTGGSGINGQGSASFSGAITLRVQETAVGLTVLSASGQVQAVQNNEQVCRDATGLPRRFVLVTGELERQLTVVRASFVQPSTAFPLGAFNVFMSGTTTERTLDLDSCTISSRTTPHDEATPFSFGALRVLGIERDANGRATRIEVQGRGSNGLLVRP